MAPVIMRVAEDDWRTVREVRLMALADSPAAFGSTLQVEQARTEEEWRLYLSGRDQFVAIEGGRAVGTIGLRPPRDPSGAPHIVSMWVAPTDRGRGVGDALVQAALGAAMAQGWREVELWVSVGNTQAERLYARHGFRATGQVQEIVAGDPQRLERLMSARLPDDA